MKFTNKKLKQLNSIYLLNHTRLLNDLFHLMVPDGSSSDFNSDSKIWYSSRFCQSNCVFKAFRWKGEELCCTSVWLLGMCKFGLWLLDYWYLLEFLKGVKLSLDAPIRSTGGPWMSELCKHVRSCLPWCSRHWTEGLRCKTMRVAAI